jgi:hypothetical protein
LAALAALTAGALATLALPTLVAARAALAAIAAGGALRPPGRRLGLPRFLLIIALNTFAARGGIGGRSGHQRQHGRGRDQTFHVFLQQPPRRSAMLLSLDLVIAPFIVNRT